MSEEKDGFNLLSLISGGFKFDGVLKIAIGYLNSIVDKVTPDTITPEQKVTVQNYVGSAYAVLRNFGPDIVEKNNNDLDDEGLAELIEICEDLAEKYDLELNPQNL